MKKKMELMIILKGWKPDYDNNFGSVIYCILFLFIYLFIFIYCILNSWHEKS